MERTGVVVSTERVGVLTAVVIKGLVEVREGQHLRRGDRVWTIVKKRWVRKPNVSVVLNPVAGTGNPEIDDALELMYDQVEGENAPVAEPDLTVETVVSFEKSTLVCARGVLPVKAGDVVTDGDRAWKVLDVTGGQPAAQSRVWLSIKAQGPNVDPMPNARLLKKA